MLPDVGKIDRDVVYIVMVVHVCCERLFLMFHLRLDVYCKCVYLDVAYVSHICCKVFYLDVVYVCNCFQVVLQVFQTHVSSVPSVFRHMLQVLHLDISKVNWVLHMLQCDPFGAAGREGPGWVGRFRAGSGGRKRRVGSDSTRSAGAGF
jgi:hypothetical protein